MTQQVDAVPAVARTAEEPFRDLYGREFARVAGYAYRLTRDTELARDIAQEAFTRLLTRWIAVREPRAYVFHVATNLARDAYHQRVKATAYARDHVTTTDDATPAPDTTVLDAIARLPKRHRDVVLLHYYADLTVPDVAAAVRRPAGTVKRLLSEARTHLATSLGDPS